jgi:hypothetical protein
MSDNKGIYTPSTSLTSAICTTANESKGALGGLTDTVGKTGKGLTDTVSNTVSGAGKGVSDTASSATKGVSDTTKGMLSLATLNCTEYFVWRIYVDDNRSQRYC